MALACRMCKSRRLSRFLDLGSMPPADSFLRPDQLGEPETYYPLSVHLCEECGLSQLGHVVSPEVLYRHDYPYEASITATGQRHWAEFAESVAARFSAGADRFAVDIGSNVGVLLGEFQKHGFRILGIDPATNIVRIAERRGIETLDELFSPDVARRVAATKGRAGVVTGTNVFAHVDDLDRFMEGIDQLLDEEGVLVIEAPYFVNLLEACEYDTIYHEHLSYLSVAPVAGFVARLGFELFDVIERDIHGGSIRLFIGRAGRHPVEPSVQASIGRETAAGVRDPARLRKFAGDVAENRRELTWLVQELKHEGRRLAGIGAPAKGMTLLNYCRFGPEHLDFVTEKSTLKIGRFTPGTHVPVLPDEDLVARNVDFGLLLAWNFADEIMGNLGEFRRKGGKFIVPIPRPAIVEG
ncbi:MAG: methyltransferase domain-containing protein [Thermoanaerobaculia bacterium]